MLEEPWMRRRQYPREWNKKSVSKHAAEHRTIAQVRRDKAFSAMLMVAIEYGMNPKDFKGAIQ